MSGEKRMRIALDAMGGDFGPPTIVAGAVLVAEKYPLTDFIFYGQKEALQAELIRHSVASSPRFTIVDCEDMISGDDKPSQAIRRIKTSSMGQAIEAVKQGAADACISGGNTGALMAMAKISLRMLPGIDRPAIAALLPSYHQEMVMLDLGANTECDSRNLFQFAVMGAAYIRSIRGVLRPRVGLLNIGTEEMKGTESLREAALLLRGADYLELEFAGFIEGDKISRGLVDVVVTDGFSGNVALKTLEGTARFVTDILRRAFASSLRSKLGFLISKPATELLKHHLDPNNHNGGLLLGLNGLVIKSHGSASDKGVANAILVAIKLIERQLIKKIGEDIANFNSRHSG